MASIYQLPRTVRPSKKKWFAFQIPDVHRGYHTGIPSYDPLVWDVGMQALQHLAPRLTHLIIYGDYGNWESLSHWSSLRAEQVYVEEDVAICNYGLDEIDDILKKHGRRDLRKVFIMGNHEEWSSLLEVKYPGLRNELNLARRLRLKERGYLVVPNNHFFKLGHSYHTHGNLPGVRDPRSLIKATGCSVFCGHLHGHDIASSRDLKGEKMAATLGCWAMIDPPPPYAKAWVPERWVHGFGTLQVRSNGMFQFSYRRIIESSYTELEDGTELVASRARTRKRLNAEKKILDDLKRKYAERYYKPGGRVREPEPIIGTEYRSRGYRARVHQRTKR